MRRRTLFFIAATASLIPLVLLTTGPGQRIPLGLYRRLRGRATLSEQLARYGPEARARLLPHFQAAGVTYPPGAIALVAFKVERRLDIYARSVAGDEPRWITGYPVLAASGGPGPKRREGDRQVPEGFYKIESLNPNSLYHLAMRIDYPNDDDLARATPEELGRLGGDIMIHGRAVSVGCLAMGDTAIEELFVLAADVEIEDIEVVITPMDLRTAEPSVSDENIEALYLRIKERLAGLPAAGK